MTLRRVVSTLAAALTVFCLAATVYALIVGPLWVGAVNAWLALAAFVLWTKT